MWTRIAVLCPLSLLLPLTQRAATISDPALGSQLAGGTVTVTRFGGLLSSATFTASGTGAVASAVGSGGFTLVVSPGDTASATWTLTNTDPSLILFNRITAVTIDLTLSGISLFDKGTIPSTPLSGAGVDGATYGSGIAFLSDTDLSLWSGAANTGDMYSALSIVFEGGFTSGASSAWTTDTDVIVEVPEAASGALSAGGALFLGLALARAKARG